MLLLQDFRWVQMQYANTENDPHNFSEFKKSEKKYRHYLKKETDFSEVIDLNKYDSSMENICTKSEITDPTTNQSYVFFKFNFPKGLCVIKNVLTIPEQLGLTKKCLNEYHKKPNRTNLYIYEKKPDENSDEPAQTYDLSLFLVDDPQKYYFNKKIRWSNIGFQYDWNDRLYPSGQTVIPDDLKQFPLKVLRLLNYEKYIPECVIVNYYAQRNYMGGHLDDGEIDQVSPIISFSLGLSCVFLIGGKTRDIKPHAIKLDSGDVLIMKDDSRLSYHGVPRVLEDSFKAADFMNYVKENKPEVIEKHNEDLKRDETGAFENDEIHAINYLSESRINFNFRQVYPKDEQAGSASNQNQTA